MQKYTKALKYKNFRRLWIGEVFEIGADWFNLVATATLVSLYTDAALAYGGLFLARLLPAALLSPLTGMLADTIDRRRIIVLGNVLRTATACAFLLIDGPQDAAWIYVLTVIQLGSSGLTTPARNALLPLTIPAHSLGAANVLSSLTFGTMFAAGSALGGLSSGLLGMAPTFLLCAALYGTAAVLQSGIEPLKLPAHRADRPITHTDRLAEPLRLLRTDGMTLALTTTKGLNALVMSGGLNIIMVLVATEIYPIGEAGAISLGLVFAASAFGSGIGPLLGRRMFGEADADLQTVLGWAYLTSAGGLMILGLLIDQFFWVLVGLTVRGIGGGALWMSSTHLLMTRVDSALQGRIFSYEFALRTLLNGVGTMAVAALIDAGIGLTAIIAVIAAASTIPGIAWLRTANARQSSA